MVSKIARRLRRNKTEAEKYLWARLRNRQLAGAKFRRQVAIGPYVVDFVCFDAMLVVEVDGGQHAAGREADSKRTEWLQSEGYRVFRIWNSAVLENAEGVLEAIETELHTC